MGEKKMTNCINLSYADVVKLIDASDSEEVSEYENHTSDEIESECSDNDLDTNNQQMNYKESVQSKDREIKWKWIHCHILINQQLLIL
ncbi:hypothetical protein TNCV_4617241 [Trichonephila clavipes]|nr:hypothetical protein TNCV_4617241 [Trichonephila clavipes]